MRCLAILARPREKPSGGESICCHLENRHRPYPRIRPLECAEKPGGRSPCRRSSGPGLRSVVAVISTRICSACRAGDIPARRREAPALRRIRQCASPTHDRCPVRSQPLPRPLNSNARKHPPDRWWDAVSECHGDLGKPRAWNGQGENGAPERIRTSDPQIRSLVLYPAELRARAAGVFRLRGVLLKRTAGDCKRIWRKKRLSHNCRTTGPIPTLRAPAPEVFGGFRLIGCSRRNATQGAA